ncbi:MAG: universal stress protein [Oceanisphaera sp.]
MFNNILIAVHPTNEDEAKQALQEGARLLADGGELHLVSVYNPSGTAFFPHVNEEAPDAKENEVRDNLDLLMRKYLPRDVSATLHVLTGETAEQLNALAAQLASNLMVLTSKGACSRWSLRRATLEFVTINAPCAVLVLKVDEDEADTKIA